MTPDLRNAVFLDTSASGALAVASDTRHRRATEVFRQLTNERRRLLTTNYIVAETHAFVLSRDGRDSALRILDGLEGGSTIVIHATVEDEARARSIILAYQDKSFSLVDAISFAVMERLGMPDAFAFDRHFAQFGFQIIT